MSPSGPPCIIVSESTGMELKVNYLGNVQFEAETRGHKLICDQPFDGYGDDEGMTPPELMLASLATCAAYYAVSYLKLRKLQTEGLSVRIEAAKVPQPARLDNFKIVIDVPGLSDAHHIEGVRRSAEKCLIKNTLLHPPSLEIAVGAPDQAALTTA